MQVSEFSTCRTVFSTSKFLLILGFVQRFAPSLQDRRSHYTSESPLLGFRISLRMRRISSATSLIAPTVGSYRTLVVSQGKTDG